MKDNIVFEGLCYSLIKSSVFQLRFYTGSDNFSTKNQKDNQSLKFLLKFDSKIRFPFQIFHIT